MSENDTNYVSTAKALEVLTKATGERGVAIDLIADALRGGDLNAYGSKVNGLRMIGSGDPAHIPVQFWTGAGLEEQSRWSWSGGYFCSKVESVVGGLSLVEYRDVEFDKWGIVDLCEANDATSAADNSTSVVDYSPSRAKVGTTGKIEPWHLFYAELLHLLHEGDLTKGNFATQKALRDHLLLKIDDALSEGSIKPIVQKVWFKYMENQ